MTIYRQGRIQQTYKEEVHLFFFLPFFFIPFPKNGRGLGVSIDHREV
jgi:hypothetical protein